MKNAEAIKALSLMRRAERLATALMQSDPVGEERISALDHAIAVLREADERDERERTGRRFETAATYGEADVDGRRRRQ